MAPATKGVTRREMRKATAARIVCALLLVLRLSAEAGGLLRMSTKPRPPSTLRCAKAAISWSGTTNTAVISTTVRTFALKSLNAPSRMSLSVIGWSGNGPVRASPAFGRGAGGGHPAAVCHPGGGGHIGGPGGACPYAGGGGHIGGWAGG